MCEYKNINMALDKFKPHTSTQRAIGKDGIGEKKGSHLSKAIKNRYSSGGLSAGQRIERSLKDEKEGRVKKVPVGSLTIGTHYSRNTAHKGSTVARLKMNKMPHWGAEDFKQSRKQIEALEAYYGK